MRSVPRLLLLAMALSGCDELFEGLADPTAYLSIGWSAATVAIPQGGEASLTATVRRTPDYDGAILVSVHGLPAGVTASVEKTPSGPVETAVVHFSAAEGVAVGSFSFIARVSGSRLADSDRQMLLQVIEPPAFSVTPTQPELSVVRGGAAPLSVNLSRINFPSPVTLSVEGVSGISSAFATNPVTSASAEGFLLVDGNVPAGTHVVTLRGVAPPLADRTAPLTVVVTEDHLQLFVDSAVSAKQGATKAEAFILNQSASAGAVTLSVDGLPTGVTVGFEAGTPPQQVMTLAVLPSVAAGDYPVTLRATGSGVPDATAPFVLKIQPSLITVTVAPESLGVFQGATGSASVTLQRVSLDTTVAIAFEGVPAGFTMSAHPAQVSGSSSSISVGVGSAVAAATYDLTIVATPAGWPADAATRKTLRVTVREVPVGVGNVLIDWSACTAPTWFAAQDGTGPWTRMPDLGGVFKFTVNSNTGAFAYRLGDSLTVRYMTRAQLTAQPFDMCPPVVQTRTVTGSAVHGVGPTEQYTYGLGGATATSTPSNPDFTLRDIKPGVHDLVVWATGVSGGFRSMFRRDLDLVDGEVLPTIDLTTESAVAQSARLTFTGQLAGETLMHSMSFLTTAACTATPLYTSSSGSVTNMFGVPDPQQRESDYHLLTITASTATRQRSTSVAFRRVEQRSLGVNTQIPGVQVVTLSGPYKRLQAFVGNVNVAYNGSATLRYQGGLPIVNLIASMGALTPGVFSLIMPDFSGVDGWQNSFAPPLNLNGPWVVTLDGGSTASPCSTSYNRIVSRHFGTF